MNKAWEKVPALIEEALKITEAPCNHVSTILKFGSKMQVRQVARGSIICHSDGWVEIRDEKTKVLALFRKEHVVMAVKGDFPGEILEALGLEA